MEKATWPNIIIGTKLRQLREAAHLTQEEFAFQTGLARTYISLLERGIKAPTLPVFLRLCIILKQKPDEVLASIFEKIQQDEAQGRYSLFSFRAQDSHHDTTMD